MGYRQNRIIHVVCEGHSEVAYLNELNKLFRENGGNIVLKPYRAVNGSYLEIRKKYREVWRNNRNADICILVDRDIYERSPKESCLYSHHLDDHLPDFLFNYMNMEDFLVLHLPYESVLRWHSICKSRHHFETPLQADAYMSLLNSSSVFTDGKYRKGMVPFEVSLNRLGLLFSNNRNADFEFRSDFATMLESLMAEMQLALPHTP